MIDGMETGLTIRPLATSWQESSVTCLRILEYGADRGTLEWDVFGDAAPCELEWFGDDGAHAEWHVTFWPANTPTDARCGRWWRRA